MKHNNEFIFVEPKSSTKKYYLQHFVGTICNIYYKTIFSLFKPKHKKKQYYSSICAIFKNETLYLREWIEFHKLVGIDHFYLYNNFSDDQYMDILEPYIKSGLVELEDWPIPQGQLSAYEDCIKKHKEDTNWIGFIDIDEFITPLEGNSFIDILHQLENRPVVKIYWKIFGSNNLSLRNANNLVIEDFIEAWEKPMNFGKCFFNTDYSFDPSMKQNNAFHHHMWAMYKNIKLPPVNTNGIVSLGSFDRIGKPCLKVQLNHYIIKSKEEFKAKKARGDVFYKLSSVNEAYFNKYDSLSKYKDESALIFYEGGRRKHE